MSRFILAARRGENFWLLYLLSTALIVVGFWVGSLPLHLILSEMSAKGLVAEQAIDLFNESADFSHLGLPSHIGLLLLLGSFIGAAVMLFLAVEFLHKRPFRTLIRPTRKIRYHKIAYAFAVWMILTIVAEGISYVLAPGAYTFDFNWRSWLPLIAICVLVLPVQTSFEELFTRGYYLQGIGLATNSKWVAIILTSAIFAAMHLMNPEILEFGLGVMLVYYISVGIFLAGITVLDDGLEYALGIHAAVNIYGAGFVSYQGSALRTEALFQVEMINPVQQVVLFYVMMVVFYLLARRYQDLRHVRSLFEPVTIDSTREESIYEETDSDNSDGVASDFDSRQ